MSNTMMRNSNNLKKLYACKTELMWKSCPKPRKIDDFVNSYNSCIKNVRTANSYSIGEFFAFPIRTFFKFPISAIRKITDEAYQTFKKNALVNQTKVINSLLLTYNHNDIPYDYKDILSEMRSLNIKPNTFTYTLFVDSYSKRGFTDEIKCILNEATDTCDCNEIREFTTRTKIAVLKSLIISRRYNEADAYIKEEQLDINDPRVMLEMAFGYATAGDVGKLFDVVESLKSRRHLSLNCLQIIKRCTYSNMPEEHVSKLINTMNEVSDFGRYLDTIFHFNRRGFFNYSLLLLSTIRPSYFNKELTGNVIESFKSPECPIQIYVKVLSLLLESASIEYTTNIFEYMSLNHALKHANEFLQLNKIITIDSLFAKAISSKSSISVLTVYGIGFANINIRLFNGVFCMHVVPRLLDDMISSYEDIAKTFPSNTREIVAMTLIYFLSQGRFSEFNKLVNDSKMDTLSLDIDLKSISRKIAERFSFMQIEKLANEASKVFRKAFFNQFITQIVVQSLIFSGNAGNVINLKDGVQLAHNLNLSISGENFKIVEGACREHKEIIDSLKTNSRTDIKATSPV